MMPIAHSGPIVKLSGPYGRVLRRLDRQKQKMLDTVEGYSPEWLTYSPATDAWSILQLFEHLIRTERAVRETAARNLALSMPRPTLRERWRAIYLLGMFLFPIRVRIPKAVSFVLPEQPESLGALAAQWSSERELLRQFLLKQQRSALGEMAMRHPAVGAMSLRTALRFLVVHLWHHQFQMLRLRWAITWAFL
jgi:hypothetical protein